MVRETAKVLKMAQQGREMIAGDNSTAQGGAQPSAKDSNEVNKITGQDGTVRGTTGLRAAQADQQLSYVTLDVENDAHPKGVPCPPWGKNCLRCGKSHHFASACPSRKPNRFDRQVRALESDPDPSTSHPEEEIEATEEVYQPCTE